MYLVDIGLPGTISGVFLLRTNIIRARRFADFASKEVGEARYALGSSDPELSISKASSRGHKRPVCLWFESDQ